MDGVGIDITHQLILLVKTHVKNIITIDLKIELKKKKVFFFC